MVSAYRNYNKTALFIIITSTNLNIANYLEHFNIASINNTIKNKDFNFEITKHIKG